MLKPKAPLSPERAGPITELTVTGASLLVTLWLAGIQFGSFSRGDLRGFLVYFFFSRHS
jgi:hypothetical protein